MAGRSFVVAALIVALTAVGGGAAMAADPQPPADVPDGMDWDPEQGLREVTPELDAGSIARGTGLDRAVVLARLRAQEALEDIMPRVERDFASSYGGSRWSGDKLILQFTGPAPSSVVERLARAGVNVDAEIVRYSLSELASMQEDLVNTLVASGIRSSRLLVASDPVDQHLFVSIQDDDGLNSRQVAQRLPRRFDDVDIQIDVTTTAVFVDRVQVRGGTWHDDNVQILCTIGFSVYKGSTDGVASAGHCTKNAKFWFVPFVGDTTTMTYKDGHIANWGDFIWYTTPLAEIDDFYHTKAGALRDVGGVKNTIAAGDPLQWWGVSTQKEFDGTIKFPLVRYNGINHLVCMDNNKGDKGDSGGPVYALSQAAGFQKGSGLINGTHYACHSQARYIDDAMGVSIKQ